MLLVLRLCNQADIVQAACENETEKSLDEIYKKARHDKVLRCQCNGVDTLIRFDHIVSMAMISAD